MSFKDELNAIKKTETSAKYITKPGVQLLKVTNYSLSEKDENYKGKPYIEFNMVNADGEITNAKFYRAQKDDSDTAKDFKRKQLKEFFDNVGADFELEGEEFLKSAVNKKLKVLLREEEYIGKDKTNNNKPEIKSIVRYAWSAAEDGEIGGNQSHLHKKLDEKRMTQYKAQLDAWESEFGAGDAAMPETEQEADDDLPF